MRPNMPDVFRTMASAFHQDAPFMYRSLDEACATAASMVAAPLRPELAAYLDRLLAGDPADCVNAWNHSGAHVFFRKRVDLIAMLRNVRARL